MLSKVPNQALKEVTANGDQLMKSAGYDDLASNLDIPGNKNKFFNGNLDIWQRGDSQTSSGYGSDDRWLNSNSGSTKNHTKQTFLLGQSDVPNNPKYYSRTVVSSVAGAGNYCNKSQRIEDVRTLAGEVVTLSFWAKSNTALNLASEFVQNFGTGGAPSTEVDGISPTTFNVTTTWTKFTVTLTLPSVSGKTIGTDINDYLELILWMDAGSTYDARTNTLGQQSGTFEIAQVQLEKGDTATDYDNRTEGQEIVLCQRYYWETSDAMIMPTYNDSDVIRQLTVPNPVRMRIAPSITVSTSAGTPGNPSVGVDFSRVSVSGVSTNAGVSISNYEADAEL